MKLRTLVAGLALIGASAGASAVSINFVGAHNLGVVPSPSNFIIDNLVTTPSPGGSFVDIIDFQVAPTSMATGVFFDQLLLSNKQNIVSATAQLWDQTTSTMIGSVPLGTGPFDPSAMLLASDMYQIRVLGTLDSGATAGFYGILGTLSPVPEPETYALMGLGLVALVAARARRRKLGDTSFNSVSATAA